MLDKVQNNDNGLQNPDNSGFNVRINSDCTPSHPDNPCYGFGVRTDKVSKVSFAMVGGQCTVTVEKNEWTDSVAYDGHTKCCGPPWVGGSGSCKHVVREVGGFATANGKAAWPPSWLNDAKPLGGQYV